ncbi:sensor histidine kinase [Glaciibacter psychrotolerans]|uniref:histidine kinase n=1 Tax=Glaciibacter psychrotolerans TaxID=670054 RepID=A0A7Z0EEI5_9MICO|nr:sensor histidine kinase [Leifsonia psychrotolerans]NYJ20038.1 signal transduction histidine kinase [Leifsonia psychrotolerans]
MPPPWAYSDAAWQDRARHRPPAQPGQWGPGNPGSTGPRIPAIVVLWLPVVLSFLVQVPTVIFLAWHFSDRTEGLAAVGFALLGPLALIGARRFPGPVVALAALAAAGLLLVRPDISAPNLALAFAIVLGIVRGARLWVYSAVAVAWVLTIATASLIGVNLHPLRIAFTTLALALMMGIGELIRVRREHFQTVRRSAQARRVDAEQRERVRIARELHDVLGHSLSQINVQASVGLHLIDAQPEKAAEALASIKATSKNALDEVRMVLGILRADGEGTAPLSPEPDLAGLPALFETFQAQGIAVHCLNALEAESAAPAATQLALYRICQEALTNVLRHSGAREASVYLAIDRGGYLLTVSDIGTPVRGALTPGGGLLGMRERAELLGGSLRYAADADGGFQIEARIPLRATR